MGFFSWLKSQFSNDAQAVDFTVINPATGLPMIGGMGGVDTMGNPYGSGSTSDSSIRSARDQRETAPAEGPSENTGNAYRQSTSIRDDDNEHDHAAGDHAYGMFDDPLGGSHDINPATGLPMVGGIDGVDVAGNPFGTDMEDIHDSSYGSDADSTHNNTIDDDHTFGISDVGTDIGGISSDINPATGLSMVSDAGGLDVGGNPYGSDLSDTSIGMDSGFDSGSSFNDSFSGLDDSFSSYDSFGGMDDW